MKHGAYALLVFAACEYKQEVQSPAATQPIPGCSSAKMPEPNERRLYGIAAQRDLSMNCIPPGGWDLTVGTGPNYYPHLHNCTRQVFEAAKAIIDPGKLTRQVIRRDWMLLHFTGANPHYYEITYDFNESEGLAVLSLLNYTQAGAAIQPDGDLSALENALEKAFYCE